MKLLKNFVGTLLLVALLGTTFWYLLISPLPLQAKGKRGDLVIFLKDNQSLGTALFSMHLPENLTSAKIFDIYFDVNADGVFMENEKGVDEVAAFAEKKLPTSFGVEFSDPNQFPKLLGLKKKVKVKVMISMVNEDDVVIATETHLLQAKKINQEITDQFSFEPGLIGGMGKKKGNGETHYLSFVAGPLGGGEKVQLFNDKVPDLPTRKGKPNECVPLAAANSLLWLAKKHKFEDKLPKNTNALVDELATDVKWTPKGTKPEDFLPGKEKFTSDRGLMLVNKKIDGTITEGRSDIWDKIVKELKAGEDVELVIDFKESPTSDPTGSHAVTVVGAHNQGNNQFITIHDPVTAPGNDTYKVDRNGQIKGHPLGKGFGVFIISESFEERT